MGCALFSWIRCSWDGQARRRLRDKCEQQRGPSRALAGQPQVKMKMVKPPAKVQIPQGEEQEQEHRDEEEEEEENRAGVGGG